MTENNLADGRKIVGRQSLVSKAEATLFAAGRHAEKRRARDLAEVVEVLEETADFEKPIEITLQRVTPKPGETEQIAYMQITKAIYTPRAGAGSS